MNEWSPLVELLLLAAGGGNAVAAGDSTEEDDGFSENLPVQSSQSVQSRGPGRTYKQEDTSKTYQRKVRQQLKTIYERTAKQETQCAVECGVWKHRESSKSKAVWCVPSYVRMRTVDKAGESDRTGAHTQKTDRGACHLSGVPASQDRRISVPQVGNACSETKKTCPRTVVRLPVADGR